MKPDEKKALALMQHIRAMRLLGGRRRAKSGRRDLRVWRRRGRMVRMIGRGNQDCGMEEYISKRLIWRMGEVTWESGVL